MAISFQSSVQSLVALLAEGVDRNTKELTGADPMQQSPSSRRAWIEILLLRGRFYPAWQSPSSRRAWIEIYGCLLI